MLVTTQEANRLIADVWFARADFARDHGPILEGIVRGIFDAMERLKQQAERKKVSELMAAGYNIPPADALSMLGDAHSTNWAENFQFFINENNPTNFERIWQRAYLLYRRIGSITHRPVPFDQVMDFSIIQKLGQDEKYSSSKVEYETKVAPKDLQTVKCRRGRDPDQHGRDPFLPQQLGPVQYGHARRSRESRSRSGTTPTSRTCWKRSPSSPVSSAPPGSSSRATPTAR